MQSYEAAMSIVARVLMPTPCVLETLKSLIRWERVMLAPKRCLEDLVRPQVEIQV